MSWRWVVKQRVVLRIRVSVRGGYDGRLGCYPYYSFTYTRLHVLVHTSTWCLHEYNLNCPGPVHTYCSPPPGRAERECRKKGAKSPPRSLSLLRLMIRSIHIKSIQHHASCNPTCRQKLSFGSVPRKKGCILCSTLAARENKS